MRISSLFLCLILALLRSTAEGFVPLHSQTAKSITQRPTRIILQADPDDLEKTFGGYTVKQRLREEVESPFRTVRLWFFGASSGSALVALYFSITNLIKINLQMGGEGSQEALESIGINVAALAVCSFLTYRDYQAGEANLKRIAKGGALAKLVVSTKNDIQPLKEYRRQARVVLAAGGKEYIQSLCLTLNSDQRKDANVIPKAVEAADIIVVPVLLESRGSEIQVGDTLACWEATTPSENDRNFDTQRSESVVAFPRGAPQWTDYLESEVATATKQGFDVLKGGFTIIVKKNGRILRRSTGAPPLLNLANTMEAADASRFGMPGDSEKYE